MTCGVDSLGAEGANVTATPYCETVVVYSLFMADDLAYRPVGSIDLADPKLPDSFGSTAIGSGSGMGSMSFRFEESGRDWYGYRAFGFGNSISKDLRGPTAGSTSGRT